ncbi:MAG: yaeT, partial [Bacteroidetes bacterium]|nr:yaeT [Bacteroidota bacterium]
MTMKRVCVLAVLCVLPVTPPLFAQQAQSQQVYKILGISVEGNSLADPAAIIANSGLRVGDELVVPSDQIAQGLRKLGSLKIFEDVQIAIDRRIADGVFLVFKVREYPRLDATLVEGADEISEDDVRKKIPLVRGQVVTPQDLRRMEKDIKRLYEEEGYLLAKVAMTTAPSDTSVARVNILVSIDEGQEVEVVRIEVEGNEAFPDGDLTGAMDETSESTWWKFWSSANLDRKKYEEDKKKMIEFYRKNGYRDAAILSDSIWYDEVNEGLRILINVHEGPQYYIRSITWEGNTVYPEPALNERLAMYPGDVYDMQMFEQNLRGNETQTDVASLYLDNGYLRFNLEPIENRAGEDSIDLTIRVYENNQFRIGQVNIKGNTKTWDKVIRRELYTRPGDYFSRASIIRSIRQLSVLNYFNPEKIKPDYAFADDKTVDLTYEVEE